MAKRRSMKSSACPVARSVDLVGDRWSLLIVRDAFDGTRRFSDFQRSLGVARNILTERLRGLVAEGILAIQPASDGSSYQEYRLTAKGESLFSVVVALRQWGERFLFERGEERSKLVDRQTNKPVGMLLLRDSTGRELKAKDTVVLKRPTSTLATNNTLLG